jgi:glycine betaine/proline transport system ATP-binding protein
MGTTMSDPAIRLRDVSVVFGPNPYRAIPLMETGQTREDIRRGTGQMMGVHACSLEVARGQIVVLMGLSGSGKSTLLRVVNGLNPVVQGDVLVDDGTGPVSVPKASQSDLRALRRHKVAMVFQGFGLLPWRSVRANVAFGLELAGISRRDRTRRVDEKLDLVGLTDWADQPLHRLSGGMQQRVGLARALATEAPILLMDEPFSALDPLIRARLQDELLALQAKVQRTILFVTHDLDEAFRLGNRIAILDGGRIIQSGTPNEIRKRPANAHVAAFLAGLNPLRVLRARDVMELPTTPSATAPSVTPDTELATLIQRLQGETDCLNVQSEGQLLGVVTRASVLAALGGQTAP